MRGLTDEEVFDWRERLVDDNQLPSEARLAFQQALMNLSMERVRNSTLVGSIDSLQHDNEALRHDNKALRVQLRQSKKVTK